MTAVQRIIFSAEDAAFADDTDLTRDLKIWLSQKANRDKLPRQQSMIAMAIVRDLKDEKLILKSNPRDSDTRNDSGRTNCCFEGGKIVVHAHASNIPLTPEELGL
jgi:hypothetical protein